MPTFVLRKLAVAAAALALTAAAVAPPASAAGLERIQNTFDDFSCAFLTEQGPAVYFFGSAGSSGSGSAAFVEGEDLYLEGWEGTAEFGAGTLAASVELATPEGDPAGTLSLSATTALGDASVEQVDERSGNTWTRGTITMADYAFTDVVITIEGLQLTPILQENTCSGQRMTFDVRSTNPASRVYRDATLTSEPCAIVGMDDAELRLSGQRDEPYLEIVVGAQGDDPRKAQGPLMRQGRSWAASLPLVALTTDAVVDTWDVTAQVTRAGAPVRERSSVGGFTEMVWVVPYLVSYVIVTGDGSRLTAMCEASEVRSHVNISPQFSGE